MSEEVYSTFDSEMDMAAIAAAVAEAEAEAKTKGSGEYVKPPYGVYEVSIAYMSGGACKTGKEMARVTFEIVAGELKGQKIYWNQLLDVVRNAKQPAFKIVLFRNFLRSLKTDVPVTPFTTYPDLYNTMRNIKGECDTRKLTFQLNFSKNKKDYDTFTIEEVFENDDIPF